MTTATWLRPRVIDRVEQAAVVALWALLVLRVWHSPNPAAPLLLISESAVALFVLLRRPTADISMDLGDWILAVTATLAPLLVMPDAPTLPGMMIPGLALVMVGNCGQLAAKLVLRRSFGVAPANRGIKVAGPYRVVRHPMYAGYFLTHFGLIVLMASPFNLAVYAITWIAQFRRLLAEERLLARDPAYRAYCAEVPWRVLPGVF